MTTLLAHEGAGASWQALVTVTGVLIGVLFLLAAARIVKITSHHDLVLPLSGVVIIASLGTASSDTLSDHVGWAIPVGVVALGGLIWLSQQPQRFSLRSSSTAMIVVGAAIASIGLQGTLRATLHPAVPVFDFASLPIVDDIALTVTTPENGSTVTSPVTIEVVVTGGTVGNQRMNAGDAPADAEELGLIRLLEGNAELAAQPLETCSAQAPCTTLTYVLDLEPGRHTIYVEFLTATGSTFRTSVFKALIFEVA